MERKCPNCGNSDKIDSKLLCHTCGSQLQFDEKTNTYTMKLVNCHSCGQSNSATSNFCVKCGKKVQMEECTVKNNKKDKRFFILAPITVLLAIFCIYQGMVGHMITPQQPTPVPPVIQNTPEIQLPVFNPNGKGPRMDIVFCIDTTGSMGDEIDVIKNQLLKMVDQILQGNPQPRVRFGVVAYRDKGDEYVTKKYLLGWDIKETKKIIDSLKAAGGGDYPESINEALHVTVQGMNWDNNKNVRKIVFLIGDASPHTDYENNFNYKKELSFATKKGIMINTISCSGMEQDGNQYFQEVASATNGAFEYLTYKYAYEDETGKEHVILNQAGRDYVVDEKYSKDEGWSLGASRMESDKKAKVCSETESASYKDIFSGGVAPSGAKVEQVNNLDSIMTNKLVEEAKKEGVTYKK